MKSSISQVSKEEIDRRISKLRNWLEQSGIDAALILQNADLFYFTGTLQQGFLYVPSQKSPLLMVKKNVERAQCESPIDCIIPIKSAAQLPEIIVNFRYPLPKRLGLELDVLPANLFLSFQKIFRDSTLADISFGIREIRSVKSAFELDLIRQAASYSDWMAQQFKGLVEEGITEVELAGKIESEARKMGHQGLVRMRLWGGELFYGHIMSGDSAAVPSFLASPTGGPGVSPAISQGPGFKKIVPNEPILFDYVFVYQGYISDCTRIFSIGQPPDEMISAHEAMIQIQEEIKKAAKPGVKSGDLYDLAIRLATESGYGKYFMGAGDDRVRFVGHGVGLELDEFPFLAKGQSMVLKKGMTIALEPKVVFPGEGVVGVENTHVVQQSGLEQLTSSNEAIQML
jgi:Xaa-Pro aminopeptidase